MNFLVYDAHGHHSICPVLIDLHPETAGSCRRIWSLPDGPANDKDGYVNPPEENDAV